MGFIPETLVAVSKLTNIQMGFTLTALVLVIILTAIIVIF